MPFQENFTLRLSYLVPMNASRELSHLLENHLPKLQSISEKEWSHKPAPEKWSKKEILGHLVDSAQNNLRRFIVTQYQQNDKIVYVQDDWVKYQGYQEMGSKEILELWLTLNRQIVRVIDRIPREKMNHTCDTGTNVREFNSLEFLIGDYILHLQHHLQQIIILPA